MHFWVGASENDSRMNGIIQSSVPDESSALIDGDCAWQMEINKYAQTPVWHESSAIEMQQQHRTMHRGKIVEFKLNAIVANGESRSSVIADFTAPVIDCVLNCQPSWLKLSAKIEEKESMYGEADQNSQLEIQKEKMHKTSTTSFLLLLRVLLPPLPKMSKWHKRWLAKNHAEVYTLFAVAESHSKRHSSTFPRFSSALFSGVRLVLFA